MIDVGGSQVGISHAVSTPWTAEQCERLNDWQRDGEFHPFTCGGDRHDEAHRDYAKKSGDRDEGLLVATPEGWRCPVCEYRQDWAHGFMAD